MMWTIQSPIISISYEDGRITGDLDIIEDHVKKNDNTVNLPSYLNTVRYRRKDPNILWFATLMFIQDTTPENFVTSSFDFEPVEPFDRSDYPKDAIF